jgi:hypothetical protein
MAVRRRCPDQGLLHHSDQGSPYAIEDYQKELEVRGIVCSMSRRGTATTTRPWRAGSRPSSRSWASGSTATPTRRRRPSITSRSSTTSAGSTRPSVTAGGVRAAPSPGSRRPGGGVRLDRSTSGRRALSSLAPGDRTQQGRIQHGRLAGASRSMYRFGGPESDSSDAVDDLSNGTDQAQGAFESRRPRSSLWSPTACRMTRSSLLIRTWNAPILGKPFATLQRRSENVSCRHGQTDPAGCQRLRNDKSRVDEFAPEPRTPPPAKVD